MNNRLIIFFFILLFLTTSIITTVKADNINKIILIETMPVPVVLKGSHWFITQLNEMGYKEKKNLNLIILKAEGDRKKAEELLENELKKGLPDIVATNATLASQAAAKVLKGTKVPIVFFNVGDPVGAGLIEKVGVPTKTNITGKVNILDEKIRLNIIYRLISQIIKDRPIRIGYIYPSYPSSIGDLRKLKAVSEKDERMTFVPYQIAYQKVPIGLQAMLEDATVGIRVLNGQVDFWWETAGPLGEVPAFTQLFLDNSSIYVALGHRLSSVELGALACITPSFKAMGRESAMLVDAILDGADPGYIAPVPPTVFTFGVNLTTALKMNIVIPSDLMELAGEHVYK